jgi:hypothetical protein
VNTAWLLGGLIFGSIGLGYFMYGKSQRSPIPLLCGIALMVYPYFVSNNYVLFAVGAVLTGIPYALRNWGA